MITWALTLRHRRCLCFASTAAVKLPTMVLANWCCIPSSICAAMAAICMGICGPLKGW